MTVTFDSDGFATKTEDVVFYYYTKKGDEYKYNGGEKSTIFEGVALPDYVTLEPPPRRIPEGKEIFWDINKKIWVLDEDHIGKVIYFTETGDSQTISKRGPIPDGWTTKTYPGKDYQWSLITSNWELRPEIKVKKQLDDRTKKREEHLNKALDYIAKCNNMIDAGVNVEHFKEIKEKYQENLRALYLVDINSEDPIPEVEEMAL